MKNTRNAARLLSFVMVLAVLLSAGIVLGIHASAEDTTTTTEGNWIPAEQYVGKELGKDYAYSFAVVGDTQIVNYHKPESFSAIYDWIIASKGTKNIQRVIGLGDITDATLVQEYDRAEVEFAKLAAAGIPYSFVRGNHDATTDEQVTEYAYMADGKPGPGDPETDPGIKFQDALTWEEYGHTVDGSFSNDMINTYQKFDVGEVKYLLLNIDYGPSDDVIAWMNDVISSNPDRYVIVATHIFSDREGGFSGTAGYDGDNSAETLWNNCLKNHENVALILSGHYDEDIIVSERVGVYGNKVTSILVDPQGVDSADIEAGGDGAGLVAMFYFSEDGKSLDIEYYSTVKNAYHKASNQRHLDLIDPAAEGVAKVGTAADFVAAVGNANIHTIELTKDIYLGEAYTTGGVWTPTTLTINRNLVITSAANVENETYTIYRGIPFAEGESQSLSAVPMFALNHSSATGTLVIRNVTFDGQKAVTSGDVTTGIVDTTNNVSNTGGCFTLTKGVLIIEDGATIQNFTASVGAAVYLGTNGKLFMKGGIIQNNDGYFAGANHCSSAIYNSYSDIVMTGGIIRNNTAARGAGAIYCVGNNNQGNFWMYGGEILDNTGVTYGAAVHVRNAHIYMYGGTISGNTVTNKTYGHAIFVQTSANIYTRVVLAGGTISGNGGEAGGSAIYLSANTPHVYIGEPTLVHAADGKTRPYSDIVLAIANQAITKTLEGLVGAWELQPLVLETASGETIAYSTSSITAATNTHLEGGLLAGSHVQLNGVPEIVAEVTDWTAFADTVCDSSGRSLFVRITTADGVTTREGVFSNIAVTRDDALYVSIEDALAAESNSALILKVLKGAITLPAGTYTIDGDGKTFYRTEAGVPMFTVAENAKVTFTNITLDGNGVADTTANGGAFKLESGSSLTLMGEGKEAPVIRGFAANQGGAIYSAGALTIENAIIQQNTASGNGGAIYLSGGSFTMNGGLIGGSTTDGEGNVVSLGNVGKNGGGIAVAMSGNVTIGDGEISYNTASEGGGGIYTSDSANKVVINGATLISYNTAKTGGGICAEGDLLFAAKIQNNVSTGGNGGGVYLQKSTFTMAEGALISHNTVDYAGTQKGSGVSVASSGVLIIQKGASIEYNEATQDRNDYGSGVYLTAGKLVLAGGKISANGGSKGGNSSRGGAIYAQNGSQLWILDGEITDNYIKQYGGAIYNTASSVYIFGGTISGNDIGSTSNNTTINAPAIYNSGELYLLGGQIFENEIVGKGKNDTPAAIFTTDTGNVYIGSAVTVTGTILDAIKDSGLVTVDEAGTTLASKTPIKIYDNSVTSTTSTTLQTGTFLGIGGGNIQIASNLVAGSRVVFEDVAIPLAENYTPDTATLNAIQLRGADVLYNAKVEGATLVWPTDAYQVIRSAALTDMVDFRLTVAFRDANARQDVQATLGDKTYTADETCRVVIPLAPKRISDEITLTVGADVAKTYTLAAYLTDLTTEEYAYLGFADLAQALINYGSAAQVYLNYNADQPANSNYKTALEDVEIEFADTGENKFKLEGASASAFHSADVEIASKVSVTVIMQTAAYNGGFTVKLGGNEIKNVPYKEVTADYIAITVRDISAADLAKPIVVTLSDGTILTYSIPAYASRMLDKANDGERINDDLKVLVKALYAYAKAASVFAPAN